jgi:hypothetical protein
MMVMVCLFSIHPDVTAVCILESFQNQQSMLLADKVLKSLGKEKASQLFSEGLSFDPSTFVQHTVSVLEGLF